MSDKTENPLTKALKTDNAGQTLAASGLFGLCRDCKHWMPTAFAKESLATYPRDLPEKDWWLDAVCKRIRHGLSIEASGGWNGASVDSVETDANFGCRYFEPNDRITDADTKTL